MLHSPRVLALASAEPRFHFTQEALLREAQVRLLGPGWQREAANRSRGCSPRHRCVSAARRWTCSTITSACPARESAWRCMLRRRTRWGRRPPTSACAGRRAGASRAMLPMSRWCRARDMAPPGWIFCWRATWHYRATCAASSSATWAVMARWSACARRSRRCAPSRRPRCCWRRSSLSACTSRRRSIPRCSPPMPSSGMARPRPSSAPAPKGKGQSW